MVDPILVEVMIVVIGLASSQESVPQIRKWLSKQSSLVTLYLWEGICRVENN